VETLVGCGKCPECLVGKVRLCSGRPGRLNSYGYLGLDIEPALWGGFAGHMYLSPTALVHKIDDRISPEIATLFNPIGAGFRWAVDMPHLQVGESILGLSRDAAKLELAREFGADVTIDVEQTDIRTAVREATGGRGADVVIDVTAYATVAVTQAIDLARRGGRVVLAGTKGPKPVEDFYSDRIVLKELTVYGALGVDSPNYARAVRLIESGKHPLEKMHTHSLPLEDAAKALGLLASGEAVHIALMPDGERGSK
jgi:threonine dehydrogenase-like Zn-dependent dehydrogenase